MQTTKTTLLQRMSARLEITFWQKQDDENTKPIAYERSLNDTKN